VTYNIYGCRKLALTKRTIVYITNLVCYAYFHWLFNPECQHIFQKQTGYICRFSDSLIWRQKTISTRLTKTEIFKLRWINIIRRNINYEKTHHFLSSRIPHLESGLVACPSLFQKSPLTGVMSFEDYVSDVIGRRFEKVRNGHRFENWTPIWGLDVD
jgi:hypothetical protein